MAPLIEVKNLKKYFAIDRGFFGRTRALLKAVDDVSFSIDRGETLGLVGESGCGKTTAGRTICRLYEPTAGSVTFDGVPVYSLSPSEMLPLRRRIQMIFQDPYASLNPRMTVGDIVGEPIDIHGLAANKQERLEMVHELLHTVGLSPEHATRFPHEFSGGQRQRIGVAGAGSGPEFIICDEPISAWTFPSRPRSSTCSRSCRRSASSRTLHSARLAMVKHTSHRIAVMYWQDRGVGRERRALQEPAHPYTRRFCRLSQFPTLMSRLSGRGSSWREMSQVPSTRRQAAGSERDAG